ncbi:DUF2399 domain-containing protein [Listeria sp. FSL L7-1582]|uniref:TIGR02679 domain-containing protein n=1 Tax=Listeria portnoyi TaxID=2713504 RepID=UPI00164E75F2|nr:TIGR02679 domain-containing protein [Listeria portnoyi]MBC6308957.1 DUF2399 domain-containing protein [Listeria portnoyi]
MSQKLFDEAVLFFKGNKTYVKICELAGKKYRTYGKVTGSFSLGSFDEAGLADIANFLGVSEFSLVGKKSIPFKRWLEVYARGRFATVPFEEVVAKVTGKALVSNLEMRERMEMEREVFSRKLMALDGLRFMMGNEKFLYDAELTDAELSVLNEAMLMLPDVPMRLPVFAQKVTGNPHAFDLHGELGGLLYRILLVKSDDVAYGISDTERKNQVLLENNIIRDDIMNFVTVNGLLGERDGKVHPMWRAAVDEDVPWNVPAKHLLEIDAAYPANGDSVWLIENSSIYSALLDVFPDLPAICTHGQFRFATWLLLKRMSPGNVMFYYAGDFDPEGLLMAETLLQRFGDQAQVFAMNVELYEESNPAGVITESSMKKLDGVRSDALLDLKRAILEKGKAGYQESIFDAMVEEIRGNYV